jgi:nitrate/nitrite transport system substrate-binding protein
MGTHADKAAQREDGKGVGPVLRDRRKFLADFSVLAGAAAFGLPAAAQSARPEKEALKFGFIKLTDMVPLAIAYEKKFFEDEGLFVTLEAQANWKVLLDRVIDGQLDGAHMLAGQPLGATIGVGTKSPVVTAFSMDLNGNGITVSNEVWNEMKKHLPMAGVPCTRSRPTC